MALHLIKKTIRYFTLLVVIIGIQSDILGQNDSLSNKKISNGLLKKVIVPSALIGSSLIITNSNFEMTLQKDFRRGINNDFQTSLDDYSRFAPLALMYVADIVGVESRNHWFDQTKNAAISLLLTDVLTSRLKRGIVKTRPNRADVNAFPSAHSAYAFSTATVMYEEFKESSSIIAYSGYAFALTTGYLRMAKNAHWFSDVLIGAGIGIAITKLVYHFDYLFTWNPFKNKSNVFISPSINDRGKGFYFVLNF